MSNILKLRNFFLPVALMCFFNYGKCLAKEGQEDFVQYSGVVKLVLQEIILKDLDKIKVDLKSSSPEEARSIEKIQKILNMLILEKGATKIDQKNIKEIQGFISVFNKENRINSEIQKKHSQLKDDAESLIDKRTGVEEGMRIFINDELQKQVDSVQQRIAKRRLKASGIRTNINQSGSINQSKRTDLSESTHHLEGTS
ncbi:hypothetical protein P618_201005 [Holospora obtusa F1]|uniref:Uncharacterized protein n=1 Tax=Holospora obtusa F1 TaxID=1399147 RepID=W6TDJ9_HOLOB|nr:hypothetical protein [Holospora obtusa]ETZ06816.1 hypothetical protein P618_201005 [Holospora obtusa F1]